MYSEAYRNPNLEPHTLHFADLADVQLGAQLNSFTFNGRKELLSILSEEPRPLDVDLCVVKIKEDLDPIVPTVAKSTKQESISSIKASYPEQYFEDTDELDPLETHTRYEKHHSLGGSKRPQLREARERVSNESLSRIADEINEDTYHEGIVNLDDDGLRELVLGRRDQAEQQVLDAAFEIQELLPTIQSGTGPDCETLTQQEVHFANQAGLTHTLPYVNPPRSNAERAAVLAAFRKLKIAVLKYENQNERMIAGEIVEDLTPKISSGVQAALAKHYDQVILDEAANLNGDLIEAYDQVAHRKTEYARVSTAQQEKIKTRPVLDPRLVEVDADETLCLEAEAIHLGNIEVDLPWAEDSNFNVSLMQQSGHQLLVIDNAFSSNAKTISNKLRQRDTDARHFDSLWKRTKNIELLDPFVHRKQINKVRDACNPDHEGLIILYGGTRGGPAKRIYYAKTNAAHYEPIRQLAESHSLDKNTPLIIRISETDKPNQLKTYRQEFHISREQARGVGST